MENDIFEVTRDEYIGFLSQIKPEARETVTETEEKYVIYKIYSKLNNNHLCTKKVPVGKQNDDIQHYYIYNMPLKEQRQQPTPVHKYTLKTQEQVQEFLKILNQLSQERA